MLKHKVVIVEDDHAIVDMYRFKFEHEGAVVKIAYNGHEALPLIKEFEPDLILLDLKMPVMDGGEMLEKLRATDWGSKIRVIILTNISKDEAPSKLRLLNVSRYVVKAHHTPTQVMEIAQEVLR